MDQQTNDITRKPLVEVSVIEVGNHWLLTDYDPDNAIAFGLLVMCPPHSDNENF